MASDLRREWDEFGWMAEMSRETGLPVTFAMLQSIAKELPWEEQMAETARANADGANIVAQIAIRGNGVLMAWRGTVHPFKFRPCWQAIEALPWDEQWAQLSDPAFKKKLLAEDNIWPESDVLQLLVAVALGWQLQYEMDDGFDYEPTQAQTIWARAQAAGVDQAEYAYDLLCRDGGKGFIYFPILNYADGNLDFVKGLLHRDDVVISLSDGGAHCGTICDAASPTYLLQHWVRDRARGTVSIENAIRRQCHDTARLYGLHDRGVIAPGYLADLNIIDMAALKLGKPWLAFDLPAGGKRLLQKADGYVATIKRGVVTFRNGTMTGALPGELVRGPQAAPVMAALAAE
jgi:N-acyl-D-aspartate/D-glutamate deacylase